MTNKETENYFDLLCPDDYNNDYSIYNSMHKLLGHSNNVQGDMESECQFASNGIYMGRSDGYQDPRIKDLKNGVDDWVLLLQIDSEFNKKTGLNFMWGDMGKIYFWIRKQDLQKKDFTKTWCVEQCG